MKDEAPYPAYSCSPAWMDNGGVWALSPLQPLPPRRPGNGGIISPLSVSPASLIAFRGKPATIVSLDQFNGLERDGDRRPRSQEASDRPTQDDDWPRLRETRLNEIDVADERAI
jgi:hypothetical protein